MAKLSTPLLMSTVALLIVWTTQAFGEDVRVAGIRVIGEGYGGSDLMSELRPLNAEKGTSLALLVTTEDGAIIGVNEDASEVTKFTDSTGKSLTAGRTRFGQPGTRFEQADVSDDGKAAVVTLTTSELPAAGANSLTASGTLKLITATKKQTLKSAPFAFKKGTRVTVGDFKFVVDGTGPPQYGDGEMAVTLRTDSPVEAVAEWTLLDAGGRSTGATTGMSMQSGFAGNMTVTKELILPKKIDRGVLSLDVWTDSAERDLPVAIQATLGLQ